MEAGIVELIKEIGNDNILYKNLKNCMTDIKLRKGESEISFVTQQLTPNDVMTNTGKIGIVIWVDDDVMFQAHRNLSSGGDK